MAKLDLRAKDLDTLRRTFGRFPFVRSVRVFGSRADGSARPTSDIDLAIWAPDASTTEWNDLVEAIEEAPIIYALDLVRPDDHTDPRLLERIEREGIPIWP
ncbi:MAG: nucleotidyltransferase family protein [Alphaproteobacteria bacterium]